MNPEQRRILKNQIKYVFQNFGINSTHARQQDLFTAINVLDELANDLRRRVRQRAQCEATQARTYEQWQMAGYFVMPGERHTGRNQWGIATFLPRQVHPKNGYTGNNVKFPGYDYLDPLQDEIPF